jgi:hypothetical protein
VRGNLRGSLAGGQGSYGCEARCSRKARRTKLGLDADTAGGRVVTYNRWPLYTYVGDTAPGQAKGQALNRNGGLWFVLTPAGRIVRRHA